MLSYHMALEKISRLPRLTTTSRLPLAQCLGRVLAQEVAAKVPSPVFTNSAMDGFAVRHAEAGGELTIARDLYAGRVRPEDLVAPPTQHCVRIMTGALLPPWADTVIPVEQAVLTADRRVSFKSLPPPGANIRVMAEDLPLGAAVLARGTYLDPERLMLAAAFGYAELEVLGQLQVALVTTGDELVAPGLPLPLGGIYNSNRVFLESAVQQLGLPLSQSAQLADDEAAASRFVASAERSDQPTLLLSSGAVSAGDLDFIPKLAASLGFEVIFHRVAIRPGRPIFLATKGPLIWLGLPGNPLASCVGWHFFARPVLAAVAGLPLPEKRTLTLTHRVDKPEALRCFFRAERVGEQATLRQAQGSAHLAASKTNNAYVELPEGASYIPAETRVEAIIV